MMRQMGYLLATMTCVLCASPAHAENYAGYQGAYSTDAEGTDIARTAFDFDFRHDDSSHYRGLSIEQARFRPSAQEWTTDHRVYLRFADSGARWKWNGRIGSDGHTWLGNASIHDDAQRRQEYFVEREIVETPAGLRNRLYSTYVGGAFDWPLSERSQLTTVLGVQDFSGRNVRLHFRGTYVHVLDEERGLSAQLRLRYFHDSVPNEFDYFSTRRYLQAIPTLQLRRHVRGWRYQLAAGYGVQASAGTSSEPARLLQASVTSPREGHDWIFDAAFIYTNSPVGNGVTYDYQQLNVSVGRSF